MILKDYLTGGFPITRRTPVICCFEDGSVVVVYNRYKLKEVTDRIVLKCKCLGVWPGKRFTDCFLIDPEYYCEKVPPIIHADIDSAQEIKVVSDDEGNFEGIEYKPGPFANTEAIIVSKDVQLLIYIRYAGLKFTRVVGSINDL